MEKFKFKFKNSQAKWSIYPLKIKKFFRLHKKNTRITEFFFVDYESTKKFFFSKNRGLGMSGLNKFKVK